MSGPTKAKIEAAAIPVPETAIVPDPSTADAEAADAEAKAMADAEAAAAEALIETPDVETAIVVMNIWISGLRDGEPWPAPGEEIILPAEEAEGYVRLGYARHPE